MNSIKNTLLLVNGNIDGSSEYNSKQIGDQSGNYWISSNSEVIYSDDILNPTTSEYHKSIAFNENSDCATVDVNHLLNFSDREFSVDTWVKFDTTSHDLSKRHIIVSKWDNTGSVDDDKVFRFYYKHTTPPETRLYYEDIYISFSSTEVLINGNSTDTFEFSAGRAYRLTFSNEYLEKDIGIPEGVGFSSNELLFSGVSNYSLDLDESGYEELDNLEDLLIKNSEDLPYPEFVDFPEDDIVSESSDDYVSYMRQRYGILHSYIVEIENGILLNLPAIGTAEFGDVEIKLSNITWIGDETSFEEDSDSESSVSSDPSEDGTVPKMHGAALAAPSAYSAHSSLAVPSAPSAPVMFQPPVGGGAAAAIKAKLAASRAKNNAPPTGGGGSQFFSPRETLQTVAYQNQ